MFEDSTFESMGKIHTRSGGWMMATFALNGIILLALILIPLLYPQALPSFAETILMEAPRPPAEASKPQPVPARAVAAQPHFQAAGIAAPSVIPKVISYPAKPEVAVAIDTGKWTGPDGIGSGSPDNPLDGERRVTVVQPEVRKSLRISSSAIEGLLIYKLTPTYPAIAKASGMQGTVVLEATISTSGTIENLRVISGPIMLQQAALDAVKQWRYRPFLLNGQPIEVATTVNVVFKLN
jgi:protein TonB